MTQEPISSKLKRHGLKPTDTRSHGAGLTSATTETFDFYDVVALLLGSADDASLAKEALREATSGPLENLARVKVGMQKLLLDAGLPFTNEIVEVRSDNTWVPASARLLRNRRHCVRLMNGLAYSAEKAGEETKHWFAAKVLYHIDELVKDLQDNNASARVASLGILIGRLLERNWWKFHHETPAMRGHASDKGLAKAQPRGTKTTRERGDRRYRAIVRAAHDLWANDSVLAGNHSETARRIEALRLSALRLKNKTFVGVDTIRMAIAAAVKRGDLQ